MSKIAYEAMLDGRAEYTWRYAEGDEPRPFGEYRTAVLLDDCEIVAFLPADTAQEFAEMVIDGNEAVAAQEGMPSRIVAA